MGLKRTAGAGTLREVIDREHPRDAAGLTAQLRDPDPQRRRWAARDLVAHPECATVLGAHLTGEPDARVREAAFVSLAAIGGAAAVDALLPLLRSEEPSLRNGAIEALSGLPQAVSPRIDALLHDADPDVRLFTVNLLGELPHAQVLAWLQQVLDRETAVNVVGAAIEVLAEVGGPAQVQALRRAAARFSDEPFVAFAADVAAARMEAA